MSWSNKRRIHLARGTTNNILAISSNNIDNPNLFTDGQPLFNKDRGYLGIANGIQPAKNIMPIKVREVEGYGNEIDGNTFTLNSSPTNHYLFTGNTTKTKLLSDKKLEISSDENIDLISGTGNNKVTYISLQPDNNKIQINKNIESNSDIKLTNNNKITSKYLDVAQIGYTTTNNGVNTFNNFIQLRPYNDTSALSDILLVTHDHPQGAIYSAYIKYGRDNNIGIGRVDFGGRGWESEIFDTFMSRSTLLCNRTYIFGDIQIESADIDHPIKLSAYSDGYLAISAPTTLTDIITGKDNNITTLTINPTNGTITGKSLYITSNGQTNGTNYLSVANFTENNEQVTKAKIGIPLDLGNNNINTTGSISGGAISGTTGTFTGDITATNQKVKCKTLEVNEINLLI